MGECVSTGRKHNKEPYKLVLDFPKHMTSSEKGRYKSLVTWILISGGSNGMHVPPPLSYVGERSPAASETQEQTINVIFNSEDEDEDEEHGIDGDTRSIDGEMDLPETRL